MDNFKLLLPLLFLSSLLFSSAATQAETLEEAQQRLNQETLAKEFSVADEAKVDAYIKEAMEKDLKPVEKVPSYWQPGYTCADIRGYSWSDYRSCRYYHSYYGYYW